jgi:ferredoxin
LLEEKDKKTRLFKRLNRKIKGVNHMGKYKVEIDKNTCQGFGACVELCSQFFQLSDVDGKTSFPVEGAEKVMKENEVVTETLELDELECVREAAEACPFNAIHIVKLETNEKLI